MPQVPLAEHDHMIKALASDRADQSFGIAILPRRSRRYRSVANAHRSNAPGECLSIDAIPITNEILWRALPVTCLRDLSRDPFGSRLCGDAKQEDASAGVAQHEQSVE